MSDAPPELRARERALAKKRKHCVSVRLNDGELARLKVIASGSRKRLGQVLREVALLAVPNQVPEPNREKWEALARVHANLNQLAFHLNLGQLPADVRPLLIETVAETRALRLALLGEALP